MNSVMEIICLPSEKSFHTLKEINKGLGGSGTHSKSQHPRDKGKWISEFRASLVYKATSTTVRATQRNPVLKNKQTNKQKKDKEVG